MREEDQSKYTIPMQFHVFGRVVHDRATRWLIGGSIVTAVAALAVGVWHWSEGRPLAARAVFLLGARSGAGSPRSAAPGRTRPSRASTALKFCRSPALAGAWALVVSRFTDNIVVIAIAALGYTVATTETYKTFFFPSRPRGKFAGQAGALP